LTDFIGGHKNSITKTMTEAVVGGYFSAEEKRSLNKNISSIKGKHSLLDDLDEAQRGFDLPRDSAEGRIVEWFVADQCMWLRSQLLTALHDNRKKMIPSNIRGLSFHCPLPIYLKTFYNVGKLKFGTKQLSDIEGHCSLVIHHIIQEESDFNEMGFYDGWSHIKEKDSVTRFFFCSEDEYDEKYPAANYEGAKCLRPNLFKVTYCVQSSTITLKADILSY
jgi:hypothetical protein